MKIMSGDFEIVIFNLKREDDGLYTATSPQLAGVCVVHRDRDRIVEDMPNIVRLWYRRHREMDVEVFWGQETEFNNSFSIPTVAIPAQIAARAMRQ